MVRRGREAGGLDHRVEVGTGERVGQESADRPPSLDERGYRTHGTGLIGTDLRRSGG